ncbi:patatin-like phospholipase family protein [Olsenella sp. YH-ols2217]|uniref:Patatin-like phospholipase family protein n=1 Tax=Kribbibacterium absianum TaxID=3044210 RepID=A0ABT6ZJT7_9ACTN|nr:MULTISPECIES: patatin-like phospholipase family protein [unclassified Olsenella]MDJ1122428.1 patatin-like phospholipase family protein [Olsenella sp. YH-ols2216]MDJ1129318.1 patatin-like phospholipase family protein [Olsenella sp. YH-ols2217]
MAQETKKHLDGVGLALAGGGWRAFSQVAVLADMERNNIETGAVAGTSMGSLVATLVAAGLDSTAIANLLLEMDEQIKSQDVIKNARRHLLAAVTKNGFMDNGVLVDAVEPLLEKAGVKTFADLKLPLAICAVDIITGKLVVFTGEDGFFARTTGNWDLIASNDLDLATCISCSGAYPMMVQPVTFMGHTLVDGGCRMNLPTPLFDRESVDAVVGVHMLHTYPPVANLNVLNLMNTCMNYGSQQLEELYAQAADIAINIPVPGSDTFNPGCGQEVIDLATSYLQTHPVDWGAARPSLWNAARRAGIDMLAKLFRAPAKDEGAPEGAEQIEAVENAQAEEPDAKTNE